MRYLPSLPGPSEHPGVGARWRDRPPREYRHRALLYFGAPIIGSQPGASPAPSGGSPFGRLPGLYPTSGLTSQRHRRAAHRARARAQCATPAIQERSDGEAACSTPRRIVAVPDRRSHSLSDRRRGCRPVRASNVLASPRKRPIVPGRSIDATASRRRPRHFLR